MAELAGVLDRNFQFLFLYRGYAHTGAFRHDSSPL